ncbi:MAG TPA: hypothetical protein VMR37_06210 [Rhabdochlamydiaceae bacterium]|jgi:hypothetical protein|nr:hypothetical protein [Rhabdochlamydiaceae bacterium]
MGAALPALRSINLGDIVFGYRSGLFLTAPWKQRFIFDNAAQRRPMNGIIEVVGAALPILTTLYKVRRLECPERLSYSFWAVSGVACALCALNIAASEVCHKNLSQVHGKKDKFLWVVWRVTPYLMMITNVALLIIEMRTRETKAITALATMGVSLLELTSLMPKSFNWYLAVGILIPVDVVALYYASNMNRFGIIGGWAFIPEVNTRIKEAVYSFLGENRQSRGTR